MSRGGNKNPKCKAPNWSRENPPQGKRGRPKLEQCIGDILREIGSHPVPPTLMAIVREKCGPDVRPKNMREAMLWSVFSDAIRGRPDAHNFISDRTEGKVSDKLQVEDITPGEVKFTEVRIEKPGVDASRETKHSVRRVLQIKDEVSP